ncbi:DUF4269 domain-containing protein [Hymenobacter koreensis]|uniref:DUF4269 domain-containing protein n=1 Tax=Hymenobacter koreensis TaxID=1084523 RepID=A0ABP8JHA9_9BACT
MRNWEDIGYLQIGTSRQRQAHAAFERLGILATLNAFGPVLAGTIPLNIDLPSSDLDLICEVPQLALADFQLLLRQHYGHLPRFSLQETMVRGCPSVVGGFEAEGFAWEVFGQPQPTRAQHAVRHLLVEYAVLEAGGEAWRQAVLTLKRQGLKTEPAFAQLLQLPGDPYAALLTLENLTSAELRQRLPPLRP